MSVHAWLRAPTVALDVAGELTGAGLQERGEGHRAEGHGDVGCM